MSINLSRVFVRYPEVVGAAQALRVHLGAQARSRSDLPRHFVVSVGGGWIGVYAAGNSSSPSLAQYLSRALEAEALWCGLAGRSLACRLQRYRLGRQVQEQLSPPGLFGADEVRLLPAYGDAEREVYLWLNEAGIPEPYRFLHAEELGARDAAGAPDAVALSPAAEWPDGIKEEEFRHRIPHSTANGIRTMFDRFDEKSSVVEDDVIVRGAFDEMRGRHLLETLAKMAARRRIPPGWSFRYALSSPDGEALVDALLSLYARERGRWEYEMIRSLPS
ncbi:MAG: hypothetical protein HY716_07205 [Planctomycetes bacterium]|nr:hypothetical protein [Planctomycetota bacterium]